jgi:DsbC/DsbD-like thiol-disulfide interchange protein
MIRTGIALLAVAAVAALPAAARAQAKKSGDVVKIEATAGKIDDSGKQTVTLTITIDKPWHIYANPVGQEDLASTQTVVTVTGKNKPEEVKVDYPKGKVEMDKTVGDYNIYEDKVTITANVRRAKGDTEPLKVKVKFQACTKQTCLLGDSVEVEVK